MQNVKQRRAYDGTLRAKMAAENEARILMEAERLFSTQAFDRVTLAADHMKSRSTRV